MSLHLDPAASGRLLAHLYRAYPEEGCGVLLGRESGARRDVERVLELENARSDSRANRYLIAPEQVLAADREARAAGLEVLGFFHSHPDHEPRPSAFDLEHAWPYYSYLIVSVRSGAAGAARAFRLAEDRTRFEPERLEMSGLESKAGAGDPA